LWSWYDRSELCAGELFRLKLFTTSLNYSAHDFLDRYERCVRLSDDLNRPLSAIGPLDRRAVTGGIHHVPRFMRLNRRIWIRRDDGNRRLDA